MYIVRYIEQRKPIPQEILVFQQFFLKQMSYGIFSQKLNLVWTKFNIVIRTPLQFLGSLITILFTFSG